MLNKILADVVDKLHDTFMSHTTAECTVEHEDDETCYSVQAEGVWCSHCEVHKAFIGLVDALTAKPKTGITCPKCKKEDVEEVCERYSFGVYAGTFCEDCCSGYRDRCGLDGAQGRAEDLDEVVEPDDYY